jgi:hypothetical protein
MLKREKMYVPKGVMFLTSVLMLMAWGCSGPDLDRPVLIAGFPLRLDEHLKEAKIEGLDLPENLSTPFVWNFNGPKHAWMPVKSIRPRMEATKPVQVGDGLRLPLTVRNHIDEPRRVQVERLFAQWDLPGSPGCVCSIMKDGELLLRIPPNDRQPLRPIFQDGFQREGVAICRFQRDDAGRIVGLFIDSHRVRNLLCCRRYGKS